MAQGAEHRAQSTGRKTKDKSKKIKVISSAFICGICGKTKCQKLTQSYTENHRVSQRMKNDKRYTINDKQNIKNG